MKKTLRLLLVAITCVLFSSCGGDEPSSTNNLYGDWETKIDGDWYCLTFRDEGDEDNPKDHDYMFWFEAPSNYFSGNFTVSGHKLVLKRTNGKSYSFSYSIKGNVWADQTLVLTPNSSDDAKIFGLSTTSKIVFNRDN